MDLDDKSNPEAVEKWFHDLPHQAKPKLTKLHFYVHGTVIADHPTAALIAPATTNNKASTVFGSTYVMDDPMTVDSDPGSKIIGRAQGTFSFASRAGLVLSMAVKLVFTEGEYQGSSLSILGNNAVSHKYREMPVLGGTGDFRLARGTAILNTVNVDLAKLNDVVEYNVIIQHY